MIFLWIMGMEYYKILRGCSSPAITSLVSGAASLFCIVSFPLVKISCSVGQPWNQETVPKAHTKLFHLHTTAPASLDPLSSPFLLFSDFHVTSCPDNLTTLYIWLLLVISSLLNSLSTRMPECYFWKGSGVLALLMPSAFTDISYLLLAPCPEPCLHPLLWAVPGGETVWWVTKATSDNYLPLEMSLTC